MKNKRNYLLEATLTTGVLLFLILFLKTILSKMHNQGKLKADEAKCGTVKPSTMYEDKYRDYQADVYFALATIIQGITIGFLGEAVANAIKSPSWPTTGLVVLAALESLALAVSFWYAFVMAYFHRFRFIEMSAVDHLVLSCVYFAIGIVQIVAFQFLDEPRLWLTINLAFVGIVFFYSRYINSLTKQSQRVINYLTIKPLLKREIITLIVLLAFLVPWYLFPELNTSIYAFISLLLFLVLIVVFNISSVKLFQARLKRQVPNHQ